MKRNGAVVVALMLAGCSKRTSAEATSDAAAAVVDANVGSASLAANKRDAGAKTKLSEAERTAFTEAMAAGRSATRAKEYAAAIAAFDKALAIRPNEPRALAERGYAKLLHEDLDGAAKDFDAAQRFERDRKLDAQIWFNIGVLRQKKNDPEGARQAFTRSNKLSPTKAAQAKLGAVDACSAQITEHSQHGDDDASFASDWKTICQSIKDRGASPVVDDRHVMVEDLDCASFEAPSGKGPWTIGLEFRGGGGALVGSGSEYVYPTKGGFFVLSHMDSTGGDGPLYAMECPVRASSFEARQEGDVVVTHAREDATDERTCPNTPPDCVCNAEGTNDTTTYYDLRTGTRLLEIFQITSPTTPAVKATITGDKLTISGGACDRTIDLAALQKKP